MTDKLYTQAELDQAEKVLKVVAKAAEDRLIPIIEAQRAEIETLKAEKVRAYAEGYNDGFRKGHLEGCLHVD